MCKNAAFSAFFPLSQTCHNVIFICDNFVILLFYQSRNNDILFTSVFSNVFLWEKQWLTENQIFQVKIKTISQFSSKEN